jgi:hypothetical protein
MFPQLPTALDFEDILLFAWLAVVEPILSLILGRLLGGIEPWEIGSNLNPWLGTLFLFAALGGILVLVTRAPGQQDPEKGGAGASGYARLPLLVTLGYMFIYATSAWGVFDAPWVMSIPCLLTGLIAATAMLFDRLPVLDVPYRRILVAPLILVGSWNFSALVHTFYGNTDWRTFLITQGPEILKNPNGLVAFTFGLLVAALGFFYLVFIFAPRQIAYPGGSARDWLVRFVIFCAALGLNLGWQVF